MKVSSVRSQVSGIVISLVAWQYARFTWDVPWRAQQIVMGLEEKPYVFRALVPFAARCLTWLGLRPELALNLIVVGSAIGLLYGLMYLSKSIE